MREDPQESAAKGSVREKGEKPEIENKKCRNVLLRIRINRHSDQEVTSRLRNTKHDQ